MGNDTISSSYNNETSNNNDMSFIELIKIYPYNRNMLCGLFGMVISLLLMGILLYKWISKRGWLWNWTYPLYFLYCLLMFALSISIYFVTWIEWLFYVFIVCFAIPSFYFCISKFCLNYDLRNRAFVKNHTNNIDGENMQMEELENLNTTG